jgi:hypothetical protein
MGQNKDTERRLTKINMTSAKSSRASYKQPCSNGVSMNTNKSSQTEDRETKCEIEGCFNDAHQRAVLPKSNRAEWICDPCINERLGN